MFAGLPVIASRVGGIPGIVVDGLTESLVNLQRPDQLAAAPKELLASGDLRRDFGSADWQRALDPFW